MNKQIIINWITITNIKVFLLKFLFNFFFNRIKYFLWNLMLKMIFIWTYFLFLFENFYIYNTRILSVCLTGYRLGPWKSYRHETGIIRTSMIWGYTTRTKLSQKVISGRPTEKRLRHLRIISHVFYCPFRERILFQVWYIYQNSLLSVFKFTKFSRRQ
jgi:hypothetical protein